VIKVMHVIGSMDLGGAEKLTRLTIEGLARDEFKASVCCLKAGGFYAEELRKKEYPVSVLLNVDKHAKNSVVGLVLVAWRLFKLLREERPHIVHSHVFLTSFLSRIVCFLAGIRCHIVTLHRLEYPSIQPLIERGLAPFVTLYVTDSRAAAGILTDKLGVQKELVEVIYNGIDTTEFETPPAREIARSGLGLSGDEFVIGVVAHLTKEKGHSFLLQSLARIRQDLGKFRLLVVGDGNLRLFLEQMAANLFEDDQIVFLGQRSDLANLLTAMDLLVLPSSWEGFGIILAEAMYMQVPVITTSDGGGCAEVVKEDNGGALVPYGDIDALGKAVLKFRRDEQFRHSQGEKGRERVKELFVAATMVQRYTDLYRRVFSMCGRK